VSFFAGLATVAVLLPLALLRGTWRVARPFRLRLGVCGLLDTAALLTFATATALGPLSVVGIVVAQTGTMAVILGMVLLHERPARTQLLGIVLTLVAVTILGAVA
jgi:drug/metabolite transporter (DMT)-like permease